MLIPYGTDSPIYYWPIATAVLIAVNVLVFPFQMLMPDKMIEPPKVVLAAEDNPQLENDIVAIPHVEGFQFPVPGWWDLALSHGDGIHPHQWITSFFIHGGIFHLIANMIFLWAFGVVVEGKIGPWMFTILYLGIGITQNIIEQVIYLPFPTSPSLGASSAIYGVMMIALFWAPQDNLKCVMGIWYYFFLIEIPIAMFALVYFLWDFSFAAFDGFSMGTPLLHVMGAAVGAVPAILFLVFYWVDGEQRDLISMFRELFGAKPLVKPKSRKEIKQEELDKQLAKADRVNLIDRSWDSMDKHLAAGNPEAATELFRQMRKLDFNVQWKEPMLLKAISLFQQQQKWSKLVEYSNVYLEQHSKRANDIRLNLAKVYVLHQDGPRKAIKTIEQIDVDQLNDAQIKTAQQIVKKAKQMIAHGVIEVGED